jgi:hypothetical protein
LVRRASGSPGQAELFAEPGRERISYERERPDRPTLPNHLLRQRIENLLASGHSPRLPTANKAGGSMKNVTVFKP